MERSSPLNTDAMDLLPREAILEGTTLALDGVQTLTPEAQVMAVAALFAGFVKRTGLNPQGLYERGLRVLAPEPFHRTANVQAEVLRDYVGLRIMGQDVTVS